LLGGVLRALAFVAVLRSDVDRARLGHGITTGRAIFWFGLCARCGDRERVFDHDRALDRNFFSAALIVAKCRTRWI